MARQLTREKRARRYLQASMSAGATGLPREHREAYEAQMRSHERAYPGVRRHALAGSRRHFDEPLLPGEREHQRELRRREGLQESDVLDIQRELSGEGAQRAGSRARRRGPAREAAGSAAGAVTSVSPVGGNDVMYFIGIMLGLSLIYLLVSGKGVNALTGIVGTLTGGVRAFVSPVDPLRAAETALGAAPISSSSSPPASGPVPSQPGAGGGGLKSLFPSGKYSVGRTDAGLDVSGIQGNIGAVAPGKIAAVHQYSGFGTTVFEKLAQPIAGKQYAYYALESGGRYSARSAQLAAGTPIATGTGGVVEIGLSSTPDVSGIEQGGRQESGGTPAGQAFTRALGLTPHA